MAYQLAGIQRIEFFEGREDAALQAVIRALAKLGVTVHDEASAAAANTPGSASHGPSHPTGKAEAKGEAAVWLKVAAAVVGLAVLGMAGTFFFGSSTTTAPMPIALGPTQTNTTTQAALDTNRVVVLPFKVIGGAKDSEDMGYGLVSTLTSKLQPLQNLVVIAKESARKFKDSEQSPREIGQALQRGNHRDRRDPNRRQQDSGEHSAHQCQHRALGWGSTFTKPKDEFLDLQNEIATKLASELKGGLDAAETQQLAQKATENPEAQKRIPSRPPRMEQAQQGWVRQSNRALRESHRARSKLCRSVCGHWRILMASYQAIILPYQHDAMPKAKDLCRKAIKLNPNLASAYTLHRMGSKPI